MGKLSGKEQEIIKKYNSGMSEPQLAKLYNVAHQSIDKLLRKHDIDRRSKKEALFLRFANYTAVSNELLEKINGWLLGDGSVLWHGSKQANFQHCSKHFEYIEYVQKCFEEENIKCNIRKVFSKKPGTHCWLLSTQYTVQFAELRHKWYPDGIKIVPNDIKITPNTMKFWIMDDGSLDKRDGILSLHTCSFTTDDCKKLENKIKDCFGNIKSSIMLAKKIYPTIRINRLSTNRIFDVIKSCDIKCFDYKFVKHICKKDDNIKELECFV